MLPFLFNAVLVLLLSTKTSEAKVTLKVAYNSKSHMNGVPEAKATIAYAERDIRRLQLINDSIQFK